MSWYQKMDIFPKFSTEFEKDARDKTLSGATLSVAAIVIVGLLFISEVSYFFSVVTKHELYVDTDIQGLIPVTINVTFQNIPCDLISIDAVDSFGDFQENLAKTSEKHRIDKQGNRIGEAAELINSKKHEEHEVSKEVVLPNGEKGTCMTCYGAERHPGQCCNTCDEVKMAYEQRGWSFHLTDVSIVQCAKDRLMQAKAVSSHEGCNLFATMKVKRVQGNIHFVPGKTFTHMGQHLHDIMGDDVQHSDISHTIHKLQFGESFDGLHNPLDSSTQDGGAGGGKYQYFVKVVPTRFDKLSGSQSTLESNQYSVTEHFQPTKQEMGFMPGVFFIYDLSPIKVHIYEERPYGTVLHLLLQLCAIGGGVFTVMGILDSMWYHGSQRVQRKIALGKMS